MSKPMVVQFSESAHKTLNELVLTSGRPAEAILERALDYYWRNVGPSKVDAQSAPGPDAGAGLSEEPQGMQSATDRITKTPGICGGRACLRGTRITVWGLAAYRRLGASDGEIRQAVQGLSPDDLEAAMDYAAANREEIDRDIRANEEGEEGLVE